MPTINNYLFSILLSIVPISELRGGLPYAYFNGIPLWQAFLISVISNIAVVPIVWIFLSTLHITLYKHIKAYQSFFDKTVAKARTKVKDKIQKYGYWGLLLFVGIPLPVTGAWTGTLGSWILGLDKKKSLLFISLGVLLSGLIVSLLLTLGIGLNSILIKRF